MPHPKRQNWLGRWLDRLLYGLGSLSLAPSRRPAPLSRPPAAADCWAEDWHKVGGDLWTVLRRKDAELVAHE